MLRELIIRDFAIIDRLEIAFGPGLVCLTGETGAGKSILVDAISVLLGGKAYPEYLRGNAESSVEGAFDAPGSPGLAGRVSELGFDSGELILRRVFSAGRGRAYVNGSLANVSTLQEIGNYLVDIHGQHEHQSLLKVESHLLLLDSYCSLDGLALQCGVVYAELASRKKRLQELTDKARERAQRLDLLVFQKDEIDKAAPSAGEEDGLIAERTRLMHADRLRALAESALDGLKDAEVAALMLIGEARKALVEISSLVPEQSEALRLIESADVAVSEACAGLRVFEQSLEADPERLSHVEGRLDTMSRLKKKYGETLEDVLRYRESLDAELDSIENHEAELAGLKTEIADYEARLKGLADELTAARKKGAKDFARKVEEELAGLGMEKARFEVSFSGLDAPGPRGADKAEFLFSANPGEPPKPLSRVASGGELSRVMLALKVILSRADMVPTLIFDEVDSGVGGQTASALGRKLREAAQGRQVICITHLPQIASQADGHYVVEKFSEGGRTRVDVRKLDKEERVKEVARMMGGVGSATASAHAAELVERGGKGGKA